MPPKKKITDFDKYCLRYCRFGICKNLNNCTMIHDPSKIAICPRILTKNCCQKKNCKLSHDKTPDKMPDCRFFLRGCCTANNCQYRHVKLNDNAKQCKDFARGICLRGLKCLKLHQYHCPRLRAKKICKLGDNCPYYHAPNIKNIEKFKKINKANETNSRIASTSSTKIASSTTDRKKLLNFASPNTKNLLNRILTKQLKSNQDNTQYQMKFKNENHQLNENLSFIPLSKDCSSDSAAINDSSKLDLIIQNTSLSNDKNCKQLLIEKKKYFIIDSDDGSDDDYNNGNQLSSTSTTISPTQICRPKLKIIPDFLK